MVIMSYVRCGPTIQFTAAAAAPPRGFIISHSMLSGADVDRDRAAIKVTIAAAARAAAHLD